MAGGDMTISLDASLFDVIADDAARESPLWGQALRKPADRDPVPVFSVLLADPRFALGLETIYEGYLLHYGASRLFAPADADTALLLGDYLYAHGLVRVSATGSVAAVDDLAELISLCAQARAAGSAHDGIAWAATAALLAEFALDEGRALLRDHGDASLLRAAAEAAAGERFVETAITAHRVRLPLA
jgi:hypothetical protein